MKSGDIVQVTVTEFKDYGAVVTTENYPGVDTLLHITDIRWQRVYGVTPIEELLKIGESLQVMVLNYDNIQDRASVGLKQLTTDPWEDISNVTNSAVIHGTIMAAYSYGLFVELSPGIEGLLYSYMLPIPPESYTIGSKIKVVVKMLDIKHRRIALGLG